MAKINCSIPEFPNNSTDKTLFIKRITKIKLALVLIAVVAALALLMTNYITAGFDCPKNENIFFPYD